MGSGGKQKIFLYVVVALTALVLGAVLYFYSQTSHKSFLFEGEYAKPGLVAGWRLEPDGVDWWQEYVLLAVYLYPNDVYEDSSGNILLPASWGKHPETGEEAILPIRIGPTETGVRFVRLVNPRLDFEITTEDGVYQNTYPEYTEQQILEIIDKRQIDKLTTDELLNELQDHADWVWPVVLVTAHNPPEVCRSAECEENVASNELSIPFNTQLVKWLRGETQTLPEGFTDRPEFIQYPFE